MINSLGITTLFAIASLPALQVAGIEIFSEQVFPLTNPLLSSKLAQSRPRRNGDIASMGHRIGDADNPDAYSQPISTVILSDKWRVYEGADVPTTDLFQTTTEELQYMVIEDSMREINCTDPLCYYDVVTEVTTLSQSNLEADGREYEERVPQKETVTTAGQIQDDHTNGNIGSVAENGMYEDGDLIIFENGQNLHPDVSNGSRVQLVPGFSFGGQTIIKEGQNGSVELTILESNASDTGSRSSGMRFQFVLSNESADKVDSLPKLQLTKDLEGSIREIAIPDVVGFLRRCGVFPACRLIVTGPEEVVNSDALGYEHLYNQKITNQPQFLRETVEVVCEPTAVSVMTSFAIILAVIIVISNFVIIVVTLRTKSLRKPHGYFKISLAVADFLNGTFVMTNVSSNLVRFVHFGKGDIEQLHQVRLNEPNHGEATFFGICAVLSQVVTVYSVLLLSVDSFLSVRWPMQYRVGDLMTTKRATTLIGTIWVFALAVSALPMVAREYVRYGLSYSTFSYFPVLSPLDTKMSHEDAFIARYIHVILYAALVWGIPFCATWLLTILTAHYSRGMLRSMSTARKNAPHFSKNIGRLERDILRTVSIVLAMLTITVLPMLIALVTTALTAGNNDLCIEQATTNLTFAAYYVLACGSFVNVIVYNACHKEFRKAMLDFLCDAIVWLFLWCCPSLMDLRAVRSTKSVRSKTLSANYNRSRRRALYLDTAKARSYASRNVKVSVESPSGSSERSGTLQTSLPGSLPYGSSFNVGYGRSSVQQSDSLTSDAPSTDRASSVDTTVTSMRDRCFSGGSGASPPCARRPIRRRSASFSSVFSTSARQIE